MNKKLLNNDHGFVLITSLLMLTVLMIIGIAATNTTTIELQISGNDKLAKQNFYRAEGVCMEAAQRLNSLNSIDDYNDLTPNTTSFPWINDASVDFDNTDSWDWDDADNNDNAEQSFLSGSGSSYAVNYTGKRRGGSIKSGAPSVNKYDIYGLSQMNGGEALIKIGFMKPVVNQ